MIERLVFVLAGVGAGFLVTMLLYFLPELF